ncbi:ParB/RepB/Spo0J family partition protein [Eubacteriales bacterium OttesenSCG-928-N13]|nr:ParB/RepB/Spo0J family partition protein [Eubacteriales bacterium OttesenSCG-928-N13]
MAKPIKHGLGRGLDALLGNESTNAAQDVQPQDVDRVRSIKLGLIDPNREQPRRRFDEDALKQLADSIKSVGVIQPIIVKQSGKRFQIIAGERRWRAARLAGLSEMPAIVRDWDEVQRLEVALIENLQRDDLNPIEQAAGVKNLMEQCGYTQEAAAERLGMSRPAVANLLRLLALPKEIQQMLILGRLSAGHARTLVPLEDPAMQLKLAEHAANQGLSVRQLEKLVKELPGEDQPMAPTISRRDPAQQQLERMAEGVFGTRVRLEGDSDKGRLVLHYYNADDLQRIWDILELMGQSSQ